MWMSHVTHRYWMLVQASPHLMSVASEFTRTTLFSGVCVYVCVCLCVCVCVCFTSCQ